jgi:phosphoribosylformylglycinamidine (FGAM) synthase PurS component
VAISMRAGLLDAEGAAAEIDLTERQLHEVVEKLKQYAGVEG